MWPSPHRYPMCTCLCLCTLYDYACYAATRSCRDRWTQIDVDLTGVDLRTSRARSRLRTERARTSSCSDSVTKTSNTSINYPTVSMTPPPSQDCSSSGDDPEHHGPDTETTAYQADIAALLSSSVIAVLRTRSSMRPCVLPRLSYM